MDFILLFLFVMFILAILEKKKKETKRMECPDCQNEMDEIASYFKTRVGLFNEHIFVEYTCRKCGTEFRGHCFRNKNDPPRPHNKSTPAPGS